MWPYPRAPGRGRPRALSTQPPQIARQAGCNPAASDECGRGSCGVMWVARHGRYDRKEDGKRRALRQDHFTTKNGAHQTERGGDDGHLAPRLPTPVANTCREHSVITTPPPCRHTGKQRGVHTRLQGVRKVPLDFATYRRSGRAPSEPIDNRGRVATLYEMSDVPVGIPSAPHHTLARASRPTKTPTTKIPSWCAIGRSNYSTLPRIPRWRMRTLITPPPPAHTPPTTDRQHLRTTDYTHHLLVATGPSALPPDRVLEGIPIMGGATCGQAHKRRAGRGRARLELKTTKVATHDVHDQCSHGGALVGRALWANRAQAPQCVIGFPLGVMLQAPSAQWGGWPHHIDLLSTSLPCTQSNSQADLV